MAVVSVPGAIEHEAFYLLILLILNVMEHNNSCYIKIFPPGYLYKRKKLRKKYNWKYKYTPISISIFCHISQTIR